MGVSPVSLGQGDLIHVLRRLCRPYVFLQHFATILHRVLYRQFFRRAIVAFLASGLLAPLTAPGGRVRGRPCGQGGRRSRGPYRYLRQVAVIRGRSSGHASGDPRVGGVGNGNDCCAYCMIPVCRVHPPQVVREAGM